jgi:hypothetical protein
MSAATVQMTMLPQSTFQLAEEKLKLGMADSKMKLAQATSALRAPTASDIRSTRLISPSPPPR